MGSSLQEKKYMCIVKHELKEAGIPTIKRYNNSYAFGKTKSTFYTGKS